MNIHTNIPLKNYLTMHLGGPARFMADVSSKEQIAGLCQHAKAQNLAVFILGGGSNTLAHDAGFDGLVIRNRILERTVLADDAGSTTLRLGGGEVWDEIVGMSVERGLSGIEAMSAIPGTVGAAPVQNIGAYGQELADTFVELEAYNMQNDTFVTLQPEDCEFSYRSSIFRESATGRYIIVSVTLKLYKTAPTPPFYPALQRFLDEHSITVYAPDTIRQAVTAIRQDKLPDPREKPNTGSFFKNAIIEKWQLDELLKNYPDMPHYDLGDKQYKIPTGWLIESVGLKGTLHHGMRVHDKNALVLINESAASYNDLASARDEVAGAVRDTFRITIQQEPLEMPEPKMA